MAATAFPSGAYGKYKRATAFFLQWLLRARAVGGFGALEGHESHKHKNKKNKKKKPTPTAAQTLDEYARIVDAIAQQPAALPATLRRQWPRAMAACESAITLRAQVARFFPPTSSDDPHLHFLQRLTQWFDQLRDASASDGHVPATSDADGKKLDFSNYYDVLDLPDGYFDEAAMDETETPAASRSARSSERKRLAEAPFHDDSVLELAYFLIEVDELSEAVYKAFHDVKRGTKTLVEATVVALVAMDFAKTMVAQLQLCQPSVRNADDLAKAIEERIPVGAIMGVADEVEARWVPSTDGSCPYQYVRGTALLDVLWVVDCLRTFATHIPASLTAQMGMLEGSFGEPFSEEHTQDYTIPDVFPTKAFLMQQLRRLFNANADHLARDEDLDRLDFTRGFFGPLLQFFETREISIELMFVCICWVRSVSALQGNAGLGRTISLSIQHNWDLQWRICKSLARMDETGIEGTMPFEDDMRELLSDLEFSDDVTALVRANPILAGGLQLSNHIAYLHIGTEVSRGTTHLRAFAHLYTALRDRELIAEIPFFDKFITLFQIFFFAPSREAAVHGNFVQVYRAKSREFQPTPKGRRRHKHSTGLCRCLHSLSKVLRLLGSQSYRELPPDVLAPTASWKAKLEHVAEVCGIELFGPRFLSLDLLKISDDVTDVIFALRDGLGRETKFAELLAATDPQVAPSRATYEALEEAVIAPLLLLLDSLNLDGTATLAIVRGTAFTSSELGALVLPFCQRAASIVTGHFKVNEPDRLTSRYYLFPSTPDWVAIEFGDSTGERNESTQTLSTRDTFLSLMEMMTESPEALCEAQVAGLKQAVKADPSLLSMVVEDPTVELSTLFHHVAAGRARSRPLIEWFIQMGALKRQPRHFQKTSEVCESLSSDETKHLCNYMAVHSAAKAGLADIVELILEADSLRDINKVTYHTRESLVHIAVRNNDRVTYSLLIVRSADCQHKDARGKYAHDYTDDASWRRDILQLVLWQRRVEEDRKKRDEQADDGAKTVEKTSSTSRPTKAVDTKLMETPSSKDRVEQLSQWLDSLKAGTATEESTAAALWIVDTIRASVTYFSQSMTLHKISIDVAHREAADAWQVMNLLGKFYRQLPSATRDFPPDDDTPLGKLTRRAGPAQAFGDLLSFAMNTAYLFYASSHPPQSQETLELLERRLLKIKPRDQTFCETVKSYLRERRRMNFMPPVGSLSEARQVFQWMQPTANGVAVVDLLSRYTWFRRLVALKSVWPNAMEKLKAESSIPSQDPSNAWVCVGDCVVVAAHTLQELTSAVKKVEETVRVRCGVSFHVHSDADNTTELLVEGIKITHVESSDDF